MSEVVEKVTNTLSNAFDRVVEVTKDRLFSPMYFYFLTAWVIVNWKFVFTLFFVDNAFIWDTQRQTKVDYLSGLYAGSWWIGALHLVIVPAITSYVAVWWLSWISEYFYKRYEEHQMTKRVILREVEYREKVSFARGQREIRAQELDKRIPYESNAYFNRSLDDAQPLIEVAGSSLLPSEVLYNTDYEAYKEAVDEFETEQAQMGEDLAVQAEIDRQRGK